MTEPEQKAERRQSVEDELARAARVDIAFKAVPGNTPDFYALQVLAASLGSGQSSRLYQKLVREKELATSVSAFVDEKRGPGALYLRATLRQNVKPETVEAAIYEEVERIRKEPVADWELQKSKNATRRSFINSTENSTSRATRIGQYAVYYNDPNLINTRPGKVAAVTKDDVQRVANKYLQQTNRTVVITTVKPRPQRGAGAPGR
jgi:predicted Zn-dependent peptidase